MGLFDENSSSEGSSNVLGARADLKPSVDSTGVTETDSPSVVNRHPVYYQETVILKVEDTIFKVPRSLMKAGTPADTSKPIDKSDLNLAARAEDTPDFIVPNVSAGEFRSFLKLACPDFATGVVDVHADEWRSILKLSSMWGFEDMKTLAVSKITDLQVPDLITLGREFGVREWLTDAFQRLVAEWLPIEASTQMLLGWPVYSRLVDLRETLWRNCVENISAHTPTLSISVGPSKNRRTEYGTASCYGLSQAKEDRREFFPVGQDITILVAEQIREYFLADGSSPGIIVAQFDGPGDTSLSKDALFFDASVTFLTGNTLFHVPYHGFVESETMVATMKSLSSQHGSHDDRSTFIQLPDDMTSDDFSAFLGFLYPSISPCKKTKNTNAEELESALHLANLWDLDLVRVRVYNAYETAPLSAWETLRFGRRFQNQDSMLEGYAFLLNAQKPPTSRDGQAMGWDTYYDVLRLREKRLKTGGLFSSPSPWQHRKAISVLRGPGYSGLLKDIREVFSADFLKAEEEMAALQAQPSGVSSLMASPILAPIPLSLEISRDDVFYCPDPVIFLAENTLFRVPRRRLTTPHFSGMLSLPDGDSSKREGATDDNPIRLSAQISARAFRAFITMLYPELTDGKAELGTDDLILALELADMWVFEDIRKRAIAELGPQPLPALEQLVLGRRMRVSSWMIDSYERLCTQEEPLSKKAGETIGWHAYGEVARIREGRRNVLSTMRTQVETAFKEELMTDEMYRAKRLSAEGVKAVGET